VSTGIQSWNIATDRSDRARPVAIVRTSRSRTTTVGSRIKGRPGSNLSECDHGLHHLAKSAPRGRVTERVSDVADRASQLGSGLPGADARARWPRRLGRRGRVVNGHFVYRAVVDQRNGGVIDYCTVEPGDRRTARTDA
jgi:hypothetical protein